jgi:adenine deaminase
VRAVLPHGTTGMCVDPHEIANVCGLRGVRLMVDEAAGQPIHVWVQMPSCVPAAPGVDAGGATLSPEDVAEAMTWRGIIGLGEMMNFPGVSAGDADVHAKLDAAYRAGKVAGGHYASPDLGLPFHGYVAGGPADDHEGTRKEDAAARARQGMKVMMRYGSAWHDVAEQARAITEDRLDARNFLLCTDDSHSETLVNHGHIDRVVRHAVEQGLPPMTALQMATLNTAEHFGLSREIGQIAPGRHADMVLASDLNDLHAELVIARGVVVAQDGQPLVERPAFTRPDWVRGSVRLARPLTAEDFAIHPPREGRVIANVIGVIENQAPTRHLRVPLMATGGRLALDSELDIARVAVIDRHHASGAISLGLVHGFGFNVPCAVASTVSHDSHHLIVVGTDDAAMALAANRLAECGGGQVVVRGSEVIGLVPLPIAGLMSDRPATEVARQASSVLAGFSACGCELNNPNMQLSLLALVVIPELRLSVRGLFDVEQMQFISVLE